MFFDQIVEIGFNSQPVVLITGAFVGAVLAAQGLFQLSGLQMESMGGALVSVGMLRELGPVLTGIMLSGRVGASMAAEIGTMKVTEQVDALRSMGVNPIDYLVTPRFPRHAHIGPITYHRSSRTWHRGSLDRGHTNLWRVRSLVELPYHDAHRSW